LKFASRNAVAPSAGAARTRRSGRYDSGGDAETLGTLAASNTDAAGNPKDRLKSAGVGRRFLFLGCDLVIVLPGISCLSPLPPQRQSAVCRRRILL